MLVETCRRNTYNTMMQEKHGHLLIPQDVFRECEVLFMHFHNVCICAEPLNEVLAKLKATGIYYWLGEKKKQTNKKKNQESILCLKPITSKYYCFYLYVYFSLPLLNFSAKEICNNLFKMMNFFKAIGEFRVSEVALTSHLLPKGHIHPGAATPFTMPEVARQEQPLVQIIDNAGDFSVIMILLKHVVQKN